LAEQLKRVELMRLARLGAAARLAEIRQEIASLETLLRGRSQATATRTPRKAAAGRKEKQSSAAWTPAARRAVSLRMKRYWAAKRQAKKR
jgi:hypothetical protein